MPISLSRSDSGQTTDVATKTKGTHTESVRA